MRFFWEKLRQQRDKAGGFQNLLMHTAVALTLTSTVSYALGLLRDKIFAYQFGASSELDIYNAAFVIPDLFLALLVTGALSAAFVPIFSRLAHHDKEKSILYTNQILTFCLGLLAIFAVIFALILPQLVDFLVPGFDPAQKLEYIRVTRLMLISPFIFTVSNTFGNILVTTKDFLWYGLSPILYNLGIIVGIFSFAPQFGVTGLVMGTILGALLHLCMRLPSVLRYGYRPRVILAFDHELRKTLLRMAPNMIQIGVWQLSLWWFVRLASQLEEGSVTIYSFARNFQSLPVSLIGIATALAAFGELSRIAAREDYESFKKVVKEKALIIASYTTLAAIALAVVSRPLVTVLLGGGKFDAAAVAATASLLAVYVIAVPFESMVHLLARSHYALHNTLRPALIQISTIALAMGISGYLLEDIGLYAIPVGFATGLVLQSVLLTGSLAQVVGKGENVLTGMAQKAKEDYQAGKTKRLKSLENLMKR